MSRLDYGTKYCHSSPTLDEEPLQRAILTAINRFMSSQDDLQHMITGTMELELAPVPGQTISLANIERRIGELEGQFNMLLEQAAEDMGCNSYIEQFQAITEEITLLKERHKQIDERRKNNVAITQRLAAATSILRDASPALNEWDEALIRQLVDTVKVISADHIIVYLRGGIETEQAIIG